MHAVTFLQDLAIVMIVAGVTTVVFRLLKQPVVLGYIIAGVIIGPHTPPYALIHDEGTINTLAQLGVILLMFSLGLEFSLRKVKSVGAPALIAVVLEIVLLFWIGYEVGQLFGWGTMNSIFLGAMLSMSSTTVIIKVLGDLGKMKERFAQLVFGVLILEDILGIAMIALLSGVATTGSLRLGDVGLTLGKLGLFLAVVLTAGLIIVPRLIGFVARFRSNEMLVVTVLGLCFGVSLLAAKMGYSVALGAFLIGAVIAEAREIHRIEELIEPVRDMFSAIFFVAIGLLIDPHMIATHWLPIFVISAAVVVGQILTTSIGIFLGGNDTRTSLHVGMSLAQIGEFSFIIASLGVTLKATSDFLYPVAVAVSALTTLSTPYLIRAAGPVADRFERTLPPAVARMLALYTEWVGRIGAGSGDPRQQLARKLLWKWSAQMALNAVLIAAIFVGAAYVGSHPPEALQQWTSDGFWLRTTVWLAAAVCALPFFVATTKKLQAFGLLLAETRVSEQLAGERTAAIRSLIAGVVPIAGTVALGLFVLILSATLLPPWHVLTFLLLVIVLLGWSLSRSFHRVYTSGQAALIETLTDKSSGTTPPMGARVLADSNLKIVPIVAGSPAAGHLIRELELRSRTGASIVALERGEERLINPGPDEEIRVGDRVLILGHADQLASARSILTAPQP
ncbi:MAG TPA: cation:proton antiporter [Candidatus Didemnitutus sp.]|nr:cation:proton antiporter [Candidatus Didemnitutus sp.]